METSVNNKCKGYTSLEQSKKLAEILPLESADMAYDWVVIDKEYSNIPYCRKPIDDELPCWSLAALLDFLKPDIYLEHEDGVGWKVSEYVVIEKPNSILSDIKYIQGFSEDNPTDACYEMIIKLHEQKLI